VNDCLPQYRSKQQDAATPAASDSTPLQHTTGNRSPPQRTAAHRSELQHPTGNFSLQQQTAAHRREALSAAANCSPPQQTAAHHSKLQSTAANRRPPQRTPAHREINKASEAESGRDVTALWVRARFKWAHTTQQKADCARFRSHWALPLKQSSGDSCRDRSSLENQSVTNMWNSNNCKETTILLSEEKSV